MDRFDHPLPGESVTVLTREECMELLGGRRLGRLISGVGDVVDVFPLNFALHDGEILVRTSEGSKLIELTIHPSVLFEVDDVRDSSAWSVIVRGTARVLESSADVDLAERARIPVLMPAPRTVFVSIRPLEVSGRWFRPGAEDPSADE